MAKYDFYCPECDAHEEVDMPMEQYAQLEAHSVARVRCLLGHPMRRVFTSVPAIFRGGGWGKS